jgi:hypothetical protein
MDAGEWIDGFAAQLGTEPPSSEQIEQLLALAGVAAHASERIAAPISCWIVAAAGATPEHALAVAQQLAAVGEAAGDGSGAL